MSKKQENRRIGQIGEMIAQKFLKNKGFSIIGRNYKLKFGEVDIIAQKEKSIRFVEVKSVRIPRHLDVTRENSREGTYRPEELVHPMKLKKISQVASIYMDGKPQDIDYQIDVVTVSIDEAKKVGKCRFIENVC